MSDNVYYPSLIITGRITDALLSRKHNLDHTTVLMSQAGSSYRTPNHVGFIRCILEKAGIPWVLVVSVSANGVETNLGSTFTIPLLTEVMQTIAYGDVFMCALYTTRSYEAKPGSADALHEKWKARCTQSLSRRNAVTMEFGCNIRGIIRNFGNLSRRDVRKPKVDIVSEILVEFSPLADNRIVRPLESEGTGAVVPGLMDFLLYSFYNNSFKIEYLGTKKSTARLCSVGISLLEYFHRTTKEGLKASVYFTPPPAIDELAKMAKGFMSLDNQTDEGWFLTGETLELIHNGVNNIIYIQPFGCLPNHAVGKGMVKELHQHYPQSNIIAMDYDPDISEVNQLNRIKLVFSTAQRNLKQGKPAKPQPIEKRHTSKAKTLQAA